MQPKLILNQELTNRLVEICNSLGKKNYTEVFNQLVETGLENLTNNKEETETIVVDLGYIDEHCPNHDGEFDVETPKLAPGVNTDNEIVISDTFIQYNLNGRIYPREVFEKALEEYINKTEKTKDKTKVVKKPRKQTGLNKQIKK